MAANLTDRALRALKPKADGSQSELFDGDARGLSARCSTSGGVTWCFSYTSPVTGKRRRLTIGSYPAWTLADARVRARELRRTVEDGGDSIDDAKAKARRLTVAQLVERYLAVIEKTHRDHKRVRRSIERDVLLVLGDRPAEDIKRRDIISILDAIVRRGAPVHANRVRSMLSAMWSWAISEDLVDVEVNPASNIKKRVEEHPGTRWLNADEIKCLGSHLERLPEAKRDALKLILLTGQRPGEVVGIGVARIADLAAIEIYERWATWAAAPSQRSDCAS